MEVEPAAAAATSEENDVGEGPPSDDDDDDEQDAVDLSVGMDLSGLSKNALKRLKRKEGKRILDKEARQALLLNTRAKKAKKKERDRVLKQERMELQKQRNEERKANMTPEEQAADGAEKVAKIAARTALKAAEKVKHVGALDAPQNIVIDCDFEDKMDPGAARSMSSQLAYCYGANRRAAKPSRLTFAGIGPAVRKQMSKLSGVESWPIIRSEKDYLELFADRKADLVYLTADSPDTLDTLSEKDIYIIGGIVDRNRYKGLTFDKATGQGLRTAKLPLGDNLAMQGSKVLTVNQVVDIMLAYMELGEWGAACEKAVPQRKKVEGKGVEDTRGGKRQKLEGGGSAKVGGGGDKAGGEEGATAAPANASGEGCAAAAPPAAPPADATGEGAAAASAAVVVGGEEARAVTLDHEKVTAAESGGDVVA